MQAYRCFCSAWSRCKSNMKDELPSDGNTNIASAYLPMRQIRLRAPETHVVDRRSLRSKYSVSELRKACETERFVALVAVPVIPSAALVT